MGTPGPARDRQRTQTVALIIFALVWLQRANISLHWLKINERIEYKLLSLTYKVLTTSQPDYLHPLDLFSLQVELAPRLLSP